MNYRQRRKIEAQKLFEGFVPDLTKSREPEVVLKALELVKEGYFSHEIAEITGKTPKAIQKLFRRYNFPNLYNFVPPLQHERRGWKGGVKIVKGYSYKRSPGHPHASKHGNYVAVHRLVVEEHLGRYLEPHEVVDHIDGNPQNNNIENLRVFSSNAEHLRATLTGRRNKVSPEGRRILSEKMKRYHAQRRLSRTRSSQHSLEIDASL